MDFERKQLKDWLPWLIGVLVFGLFIFQWYSAFTRADARWVEYLQEQKRAFDQSLITHRTLATKQAYVVANLIAQDSEIIQIIQAEALHPSTLDEDSINTSPTHNKTPLPNTQQALHDASKTYWATLNQLGASQLTIFGARDGIVLYRANSPEKFGDKLGKLRPMVDEVFNTNHMQEGMDVGRMGSAYRSIVPVFDFSRFGAQAVGAVEVGFGLIPMTLRIEAPESDLRRPDSTDTNHDTKQITPAAIGDAVLLHSSLVAERLTTEAKARLTQVSTRTPSEWLIESASDLELVKTWLRNNLLGDPLDPLNQPLVIEYENKYFLISANCPDFFKAKSKNPFLSKNLNNAADAKLVVLNWRDISEDYAALNAEKISLTAKWLIALVLTELALWVLFYFQNKRIARIVREHNAQLKKEHALTSQSEQRLMLALASSDSGFWEWDIAHNRANFSAQWRELCGLASELSAKGDMEAWLDRVHPADKRASYDAMMLHVKGETPIFENEYRLRISDGTYRWIFTRGKVVEWQPDGKAALMLGVYTDINERKKNEIIVIRQQGALHALNEIASMSGLDAEEQLRRALVVGARYLGLNIGTISCIQGNQYQTRLKICDEQAVPVPEPEALSNYFCEFTFRQQNIFSLNDVTVTEYAQHRAHTLYHQQSYIGVPIYLKGKIYGTLSFASESVRNQVYDTLDRDFMSLLTRWVSVTLERWEYQNEQKLFISRFNKLCEQLPGFLFQFQIDPDGQRSFPYASSGIYDIFGFLPEEVAESCEKLFARVHRDDIDWLEQGILQSKEKLVNWAASFRVVNRTRGEIWVQVDACPELLANGRVQWNGFLSDTSDAKRSEMQLRSVNELSEAIFEAANMSIISTDRSGLIKTFNRGAENLLGYKASEVINLVSPVIFHMPEDIEKCVPPADAKTQVSQEYLFSALISKLSDAEGSECECTYKRKNGSLIAMNLSFTCLRDSNQSVYGYLIVGRDITEVKRADQLKNELISTVSHALRTPLTAISGSLGILTGGAAGDLPETAKKLLHIAQSNSQRLTHIADDLLDLETLSSGVMEIKLAACSLLPILKTTIDSFSTSPEKTADQTTAVPQVRLIDYPDENIFVLADALRLQQVMDNFLSNAKKFSPENSPIDIVVTTEFNRVRITVVDQGSGVAENFREKLFEKFAQADDLELPQRTGSGLSLAINKEIAERMGAQVGYEPNPGQGSRFYIEFDYSEKEEDLNQVSERTHWTHRILLAEHDPEIAELLSIMLRTYHYRVDRVQTGVAALEKIATHTYQAVILDADLPDRDGDLLVHSIKQDASTKRVPIILLSNFHYELQRKKILDPVFKTVEWLPKPPNIDELLSSLHRVINQPTQQKEIST